MRGNSTLAPETPQTCLRWIRPRCLHWVVSITHMKHNSQFCRHETCVCVSCCVCMHPILNTHHTIYVAIHEPIMLSPIHIVTIAIFHTTHAHVVHKFIVVFIIVCLGGCGVGFVLTGTSWRTWHGPIRSAIGFGVRRSGYNFDDEKKTRRPKPAFLRCNSDDSTQILRFDDTILTI